MREYRSGTKWCIWRWTFTDSGYLTRLHLVKTPWFAVCLHWLHKPDPEPYLHDHPVSFFSIILRGWYYEIRNHRTKRHRWFNFIRASKDDIHRIALVAPNTLTLCFMGPKVREWGFHCAGSWIHWKAYYTLQREGWIA